MYENKAQKKCQLSSGMSLEVKRMRKMKRKRKSVTQENTKD